MIHTLAPTPALHTPYPHYRTVSAVHIPTQRSMYTQSPYMQLPFPDDPLDSLFPVTASGANAGKESYGAFLATRSRVIRVFNLPPHAASSGYLNFVLFQSRTPAGPTLPSQDANTERYSVPHTLHTTLHANPSGLDTMNSLLAASAGDGNVHGRMQPPRPLTMWTLREEYGGRASGQEDSAWAVFRTHEEACAAISLASSTVSVASALECDLEPFEKLRRFAPQLWPGQQETTSLQHQFHLKNSVGAVFNDRPETCERLTGHHVGMAYAPDAGSQPRLASSLFHHPHPGCSLHSLPNVPTLESLRISNGPQTPSALSDCSLESNYGATFHSTSDIQARLGLAAHGGASPYTLSTNPPNPRTTFRVGDWICASTSCAAHNFGRNTVCIGCGSGRPMNTLSNAMRPSSLSLNTDGLPPAVSPRVAPSPRFHSNSFSAASPTVPNAFARSIAYQTQPASPSHSTSKAPLPSHPLLTPSGRALAVGGKVQNVSIDPLSPCIIWWPDNEPLPEQGQIRPAAVVTIPQPPILNTGNRGPIEHQPGDWVCQKCEYLNWRRRKVCQTCFPYAEGNGDSISSSIQAERVALLSSVLAQNGGHLPASPSATRTRLPPLNTVSDITPSRPTYDIPIASGSPNRSYGNIGSGRPSTQMRSAAHEAMSNRQPWLYQTVEGSRFSPPAPPSPLIYETSGHRTPPSPFSLHPATGPEHELTPVPGAHLPSFLNDLGAPSLSPTSTSSAEFSVEEYEEDSASPINLTSRSGFYAHESHAARGSSGTLSVSAESSSSSVNLGASVKSIASIWKVDGEESRAWPTVKVPSPKNMAALPRIN